MFISVRSKLIIMAVAVVLATSASLIYLSINEHKRLYSNKIETDSIAISENLSHDLVEYLSGTSIDHVGISTELLQLENYEQIKYALVIGRNGELLEKYINPDKYSQALANEISFKLKENNFYDQVAAEYVGEDLIVSAPVGSQAFNIGLTYVSIDYKSELEKNQTTFLTKLIPATFVIVLVILFISQWLQSTTVKPLINLSKLIVDVVESNNYSLRSNIKSHDEVQLLGHNINKLLETISEQKSSVDKHTQTLIEQQNKLIELANTDSLTGLPNRKLFMEILDTHLSKARKEAYSIAVLFLDIDDFKTVNDSLGHASGDELLVVITKRLQKTLDKEVVISRIGGDEFAVIYFNNTTNFDFDVSVTCSEIINDLSKPMLIKEWDIQVGVSIGVAYNKPFQISLMEMMSNADTALYRAKEGGRNQSVVYSENMQSEQSRRLQIASAISKGLKYNEFELVYQPKVCSKEGVVGLEALIRWNSSHLGFVSPAEFIPIAEKSGKIHEISLWVINQGFRQANELFKKYQDKIKISFNLSAYDIIKPNFINYITSCLTRHNIPASLIEFEITESVYMENFETAQLFMSNIQSIGCSIALDDFGTGYSSLSYLTQVKADTLKVDQQFVKNLFKSDSNRVVVESIISLGKKLKLHICAEGVETYEQYQHLKACGCDTIQGYFFSKPVPYYDLDNTIYQLNQKILSSKSPGISYPDVNKVIKLL